MIRVTLILANLVMVWLGVCYPSPDGWKRDRDIFIAGINLAAAVVLVAFWRPRPISDTGPVMQFDPTAGDLCRCHREAEGEGVRS